jgi:hypothetical protein
MNLRLPKLASLARLIVLISAGFVTACLAQAQQVSNFDPLQAFSGTWTATSPGETAPYLKLTFTESNGQLTGLSTHFKMAVIGKGLVVGSPVELGESPVADVKIRPGDLSFTWDGDTRWPATQAKFSLQGTERAILVFGLPAETQQKIMRENPGAQGFAPVIALSRETEAGRATPTKPPGGPWEIAFMARLINTAEAQYKFKNGHYADYATLIHSGQLEETLGHEFHIAPDNYKSETDPLPGYRLNLSLAPDAGSYRLSIQEKAKADRCGVSLATDETGIISDGKPADCPAGPPG